VLPEEELVSLVGWQGGKPLHRARFPIDVGRRIVQEYRGFQGFTVQGSVRPISHRWSFEQKPRRGAGSPTQCASPLAFCRAGDYLVAEATVFSASLQFPQVRRVCARDMGRAASEPGDMLAGPAAWR
jgi:hypothetical protein